MDALQGIFVLTSEQKPLDPAQKPVRGVVRCQVRRSLLAAFISMVLKNQAGAQVPDFEFKGLGLQVHHQVSADHSGTPSESSTSECRPVDPSGPGT